MGSYPGIRVGVTDSNGKRVSTGFFAIVVGEAAGVEPDYANLGGTGLRQGMIAVTSNIALRNGQYIYMLDGSRSYWTVWVNNAEANSSGHITFDFRALGPQVLAGINFTDSRADRFHGPFQLKGSNDGMNFTDIGTLFIVGGAPSPFENEVLFDNEDAYRIYLLQGGPTNRDISYYTSQGGWSEVEFVLAPGNPPADPAETSYLNPGGTGDRLGLITATATLNYYDGETPYGGPTKLIDGKHADQTDSGWQFAYTVVDSGYPPGTPVVFQFDFGERRIVDEAVWLQTGTHATAHGSGKGPMMRRPGWRSGARSASAACARRS